MYVPLDVLLGSARARALAHSALPDAPVEPPTRRRTGSPIRLNGRRRRTRAALPRAGEVTTLDV